MVDIVYIKLVNGEELFAELHGEHEGKLLLSDVMVMETVGVEETVKYMFMSRYSPYSINHSMEIDKKMVIFLSEVTEITKIHYERSLTYAREVSDKTFFDGIKEASEYLEMVTEKDREKRSAKDQFTEFQKPQPTKH